MKYASRSSKKYLLKPSRSVGAILARYPNRAQVKPGLTGLAQIKGFRGEIETPVMLQQRLEQDLAYVADWSLWFDLKILALTPIRCFLAKKAY